MHPHTTSLCADAKFASPLEPFSEPEGVRGGGGGKKGCSRKSRSSGNVWLAMRRDKVFVCWYLLQNLGRWAGWEEAALLESAWLGCPTAFEQPEVAPTSVVCKTQTHRNDPFHARMSLIPWAFKHTLILPPLQNLSPLLPLRLEPRSGSNFRVARCQI